MIQFLLSKYCKDANSRNALVKGDEAIFIGKDGRPIKITIDSYLMKHESAPGDGLGYECIFHDDGSRCFASADNLHLKY